MGCITSQESKTVTPDASLADSTDGIGNRTTGLRYLTHGPDGRHTPAGQDTKDSGDKAWLFSQALQAFQRAELRELDHHEVERA